MSTGPLRVKNDPEVSHAKITVALQIRTGPCRKITLAKNL